jgi:hypothetical protein
MPYLQAMEATDICLLQAAWQASAKAKERQI